MDTREAHVLDTHAVAAPARGPRAHWIVLALAALVVVARSAVFVFWEGSHFDSNQAVIGLMAKHLAELRAFPVFMYGQPYQLAVEAWLAAPLFAVAGASVTALKLPLLAINLAIGGMVVWLLVRDAGLRPAAAGLASVFFLLPGPGTASKLLEASGGTLEPLFYVPLLWVTRRRPVWFGLVLGVGFLHREFTIYGFAALLVLAAANGSLWTRDSARRLLTALRVAAEVWLVVQVMKAYGSAAGPGTTGADLGGPANNVAEVAGRICMDWAALPGGFVDIATVHWPLLFGTAVQPLRSFVIESNASQGMPGASWLLGGAMLLAAVRVAARILRERRWRPEYGFCAYLVLVGLFSVGGYVLARCGVVQDVKMRYDMLSLLGAVGLAGWYLSVERSRTLRSAWIALVLAWAAVSGVAHARLLGEYLRDAPVGGKRLIVRHLDARGIRYGISEYATAYPVAFLSNERIIFASSNRVRIRQYEEVFRAHRGEAVRVSRHPCPGGERADAGIYLCRP